MAHTCPECGQLCHCRGDIESVDYGELYECEHCPFEGPGIEENDDDEFSDIYE